MSEQVAQKGNKGRRSAKRVMRGVLWTVGGLLALIVILLCIATWMLTPDRLTRIVNRELSREFGSDVTAHNVRFTVWSSFPHLHIELDSVTVMSRALDSLPLSLKERMPRNAAFLASSGHLSGGINLKALLVNKIELRDVEIDALRLNLVRADDSTANWDIVTPSKSEGIPYFSFNSLRLTNPYPVSYTSVPANAVCSLMLDKAELCRLNGTNDYNVTMEGMLDADINDRGYLHNFPIGLAGKISLGFHPFRFRTDNYSVILGNTRGHVNVSMELEKEPRITKFDYSLESFDLNGLLRLLPTHIIPALRGLDANIGIEGNARITGPYRIGSGEYPDGTLSLTIPSGSLVYDNEKYGKYRLNNVEMSCRLAFDGKHPAASSLYVPYLRIRDRGTELELKGRVRDIGDDPEIEVSLTGATSMENIAGMVPALRKMNPKGDVTSDMSVTFRLSELREGGIRNLRAKGEAKVDGFRMNRIGSVRSISADNLALRFHEDAGDIAPGAMSNTLFDFGLTAGSVSVAGKDFSVGGKSIALRSRSSEKGRMTFRQAKEYMPFDVALTAGSIRYADKDRDLKAGLDGLTLTGDVISNKWGSIRGRDFRFAINGNRVSLRKGESDITMDDVRGSLSGRHTDKPVKIADYPRIASWEGSDIDSSLLTTPRVLRVRIPRRLREIMERWRVGLTLTGRGGSLLTPAFPVRNRLTGIDMSASFDSLVIRKFGMRSQKSSGYITGSVSNLRQFLASHTPAPLRFRFNAVFDTIQLNQMAGAYRQGMDLTKGVGSFERMIHDTVMTRADSTAVLIPRNLDIGVGVNIRQVQYTNIRYNDCKGRVRTHNGDFRLEDVTVNTDFVDFAGHLRYDSSDLNALSAALHLDMDSLDVTRFFYYFHTMSLMVPALTKISGMLNIGTDVSTRIYPTMYAMIPSASVGLDIDGHDIRLTQTPEIHKYTRLLGMGSDPIRIGNLNVHADLRDNLLRIYPFNLRLDQYDTKVMGLSSLGGSMFFHIAVRKWPLSIPFGINVKGTFRHPEVRIGGTKWFSDYGTDVANDIMAQGQLNILYEAKRIILDFIQKAAEADKTPASEYLTF